MPAQVSAKRALVLLCVTLVSLTGAVAQEDLSQRSAVAEEKASDFKKAERYDSAVHYFKVALGLYERSGNLKSIVRCQLALGTTYYYSSDFAKAEDILSQALVSTSKTHPVDHVVIADVYNVLGSVCYQKGDYEKAGVAMKNSLKHSALDSSNDSSSLVVGMQNLAAILSRLGNFDEAIALNLKCVRLMKRSGEPMVSLADVYNNLNVCFYRKKNYPEALRYAELAFNIYRADKTGDRTNDLIACYNSMAIVLFELKRYDAALDYLDKAKVANRTQPFMIEKTYHNLGYVHRQLGNDDLALDFLRTAQQMNAGKFGATHPDIGKEYRHIGLIAARKGRFGEAVRYYQQALQILVPAFSDSNYFANPVSVVGARSRPDLLRTLHDKGRALQEIAEIKSKNGTGRDAKDYARAALGSYRAAMATVDLMRDEFELESSRQFVTEEARPLFEDALRTLWWIYRNDPDEDYRQEIFSVMERSKALALLEELQVNTSPFVMGVPDSLLRSEKEIKRAHAYYEKQYHDAQVKKDSIKMELHAAYFQNYQLKLSSLKQYLKTNYPRYYEAKYTSAMAVKSVQDRLVDRQTAYLEYFVGQKHLFILSITRGDIDFYGAELPASFPSVCRDFYRSVSDVRFVLDSAEAGQLYFTTSASALYDLLLRAPVRDLQASVKKLCIVPDGFLFNVPFECLLMSPAGPTTSYADMSYLIRRYAITYGYSVQSQYALAVKPQHSPLKCLAIAPGFSDGDVTSLASASSLMRSASSYIPGSVKEVAALAEHADGEFYGGSSATELNFKNRVSKFSVIHLATHGVADREYPSRSYLRFATNKQVAMEDDSLYAYEISNLDLQSDLVVLSACETAVGKYFSGEGSLTLSRNFLYAGSKSVVSSLWRVEDQVSSDLMHTFYEDLIGGYSKGESLQRSKLKYLSHADNMQAHPIFWAPFIVVGDDAPLTSGMLNIFVLFSLVVLAAGAFVFFRMKRKARSPVVSR